MKKTLEFIRELNIKKTDYIVVGCSGGPDSMCLLNVLKCEGYKPICAHVNHNIRKESTEEQEFLKEYCIQNKIDFECIEFEKNLSENEAYYRERRYKFYRDIADKYSTKYIMTAHHGDDLIETILMRLTRGSKLKGYAGYPKIYERYGYYYVKPLIFLTKEEIIDYLTERNIPYVLDKSNESDDYTRNRYRHKVLPFLKKESHNVHEKYLYFSEEVEKASNYIDKVVNREKENNFKDGRIDLKKFNELDEYIKQKEIELILSELYGDDIKTIRKVHIDKLLKKLKDAGNFELDFPKGFIIKKEYDNLIFTKKREYENYDLIFEDNLTLPNGDQIVKVNKSDSTSNYVIRLNSDNIYLPLHVRSRREGDKIEIKNMKGSKKIKTIFIDEKIESSKRETWPIVVDSKENIIWVPSLRKSKFDTEKDQKYDIILKYVRKEQTDEEK